MVEIFCFRGPDHFYLEQGCIPSSYISAISEREQDHGQEESQLAGLVHSRTLFIGTDGDRDAIETINYSHCSAGIISAVHSISNGVESTD